MQAGVVWLCVCVSGGPWLAERGGQRDASRGSFAVLGGERVQQGMGRSCVMRTIDCI